MKCYAWRSAGMYASWLQLNDNFQLQYYIHSMFDLHIVRTQADGLLL